MDSQQASTVQHMELSQSYVAAWMGGEFGGEWMHVYGWLSPFGVHLKLPQHGVLISYESESCSVFSDSLQPHGLYTVYGILQARILEWVPFLFSRGFSQPRDRTQVSRIPGGLFTSRATREAQEYWSR